MNEDQPVQELRDASDLPELHEGRFGPDELAALEADLAAFTELESVLPRPRVRSLVPPAPVSLSAGFAGLRDGTLRGLQIRYRHAGDHWCDTLLADSDGVRVVRMRTPTG